MQTKRVGKRFNSLPTRYMYYLQCMNLITSRIA